MVRPILYISGPYTGNEFHSTEENIKTARQYAITAWEKGWAALVPHLNTAGFEKNNRVFEARRLGRWVFDDSIAVRPETRRDPDAPAVDGKQRLGDGNETRTLARDSDILFN